MPTSCHYQVKRITPRRAMAVLVSAVVRHYHVPGMRWERFEGDTQWVERAAVARDLMLRAGARFRSKEFTITARSITSYLALERDERQTLAQAAAPPDLVERLWAGCEPRIAELETAETLTEWVRS